MTELEIKYLKHLENIGATDIKYKSTIVKYQDGFTGEWGEYSPSFTFTLDDIIEHVEVLPASKQFPKTEYLYAQNNIDWRMISSEELSIIGESDCDILLVW